MQKKHIIHSCLAVLAKVSLCSRRFKLAVARSINVFSSFPFIWFHLVGRIWSWETRWSPTPKDPSRKSLGCLDNDEYPNQKSALVESAAGTWVLRLPCLLSPSLKAEKSLCPKIGCPNIRCKHERKIFAFSIWLKYSQVPWIIWYYLRVSLDLESKMIHAAAGAEMHFQSITSGDCHVVHQTKARRSTAPCMVARWATKRKAWKACCFVCFVCFALRSCFAGSAHHLVYQSK